MSFFPADSQVFGPLFRDPEVAEVFSDERIVRAMLDVEAALARAEVEAGVIPAEAGERIAEAAASCGRISPALRAGTERAGFPVIELVRQLRAEVGGEAAGFVHWGATTQDIMDTALALQMREALARIRAGLERTIAGLARLAATHRDLVGVGRTHGQQAVPTTFGVRVAGWLAPLLRSRRRLEELTPRLLVAQLGGAAGTLAPLGGEGPEVRDRFAALLDLGRLPMPWHTQRDGLAEAASWLSLVTGSLAKMAQDVILLAQTEVGEVRESPEGGRGGSSTMPQKSNPVASEAIVASARANAALLSAVHQAQIHEQERATHGWQLEWLSLPQMFGLTSGALAHSAFLAENLEVDEARVRRNLEASNGMVLAEAAQFALAAHMDPVEAKALVTDACRSARSEGSTSSTPFGSAPTPRSTGAPCAIPGPTSDRPGRRGRGAARSGGGRVGWRTNPGDAGGEPMNDVVILSAVRTPIGRIRGALSDVRPDDLAALVVGEAVVRAGVDPAEVEEVYLGCANQSGEDNRNVARMAALLAGLPDEVAGVTVNRLCASGLNAVNQAARAIRCGEGEVFVAGGVESMTRAPYSLPKNPRAFGPSGNVTGWDTTLGWRYPNPKLEARFPLEAMGETAENIYDLSCAGEIEGGKIGREEQDRFAFQSHERAVRAIADGRFEDEIVPVRVPRRRGEPAVFDTDEHPRYRGRRKDSNSPPTASSSRSWHRPFARAAP